jgi:hypothetical protein
MVEIADRIGAADGSRPSTSLTKPGLLAGNRLIEIRASLKAGSRISFPCRTITDIESGETIAVSSTSGTGVRASCRFGRLVSGTGAYRSTER